MILNIVFLNFLRDNGHEAILTALFRTPELNIADVGFVDNADLLQAGLHVVLTGK